MSFAGFIVVVSIGVGMSITCDNDYCDLMPNNGDVITIDNANATVKVNCVNVGQCNNIVGYFDNIDTQIICNEHSCGSSQWIFGEQHHGTRQTGNIIVTESNNIYIETNDRTVLKLRLINSWNTTINCSGIECNIYSDHSNTETHIHIQGSGTINCYGFSITNICTDKSEPIIDKPLPGSCKEFAGFDNCGYQSNGECYCDSRCLQRNDCCQDYIDTCNTITFSMILYATIIPLSAIILLGLFAWFWVIINNKSSLKEKLVTILNYNSTQKTNKVEMESLKHPSRSV